MKINQKYLEIGLVFVIVIILVAAFTLGYKPYQDKKEALESECGTLRTRIDVLQSKLNQQEDYQQTIDNANSLIEMSMKKYGPGNTMEKEIMMVVDMVAQTGVVVNSMSFTDPQVYFESTDVDEEGVPNLVMKKSTLAMNIVTGYTSMKRMFDYVNNYPERMNFENFTLARDPDSGMLSGTALINLYGVEDDNHEYVAPVVENIMTGTTSIFGGYRPLSDEEKAKLQEMLGPDAVLGENVGVDPTTGMIINATPDENKEENADKEAKNSVTE